MQQATFTPTETTVRATFTGKIAGDQPLLRIDDCVTIQVDECTVSYLYSGGAWRVSSIFLGGAEIRRSFFRSSMAYVDESRAPSWVAAIVAHGMPQNPPNVPDSDITLDILTA